MLTINESGLYALIFRSRKEQARHFRKWVTAEVLPAIRKTGSYHVSSEAGFAHKRIHIQHDYPLLPPVTTEEALVAGLLARCLDFSRTLCDRMVCAPATIADIARREGGFDLWLGNRGGWRANARFMQRMRAYCGRPLRVSPDAVAAYSIVPEGVGETRRYVIGCRTLPRAAASYINEYGDAAIRAVQSALAAGEEVTLR